MTQKRRKKAWSVAFVIRLVCCVLASASPGCGSEKSARAEAGEVLERIARLDPNAPPELRRAALAQVSSLAIEDRGIRELRAVCLKAHQGLLDAEVAQAEVRAALDAKTPPAADQVPALQAKMEQANATLVAAHAAMTTCEERSREATVRYR